MKIVEGSPLTIDDLYIGRLIVVSNQILNCPVCNDLFAVEGNSIAEVTEIHADRNCYQISFKVNFPTCPRCKRVVLGMICYVSPSREDQRKQHRALLHKSGALN